MAARLTKIINVRVDATAAAAIERRVACEGGTLSDFARHALTATVRDRQGVRADPDERRERAALLARFARVTTDLRRLGSMYIYALKAGRPVSAEEERTRIDALAAVRDAARRLVGP